MFSIFFVFSCVFFFGFFFENKICFLCTFSGSAAANTFAQVFNCFALFCFIRWQKLHEKTWGGECQYWGSYFET